MIQGTVSDSNTPPGCSQYLSPGDKKGFSYQSFLVISFWKGCRWSNPITIPPHYPSESSLMKKVFDSNPFSHIMFFWVLWKGFLMPVPPLRWHQVISLPYKQSYSVLQTQELLPSIQDLTTKVSNEGCHPSNILRKRFAKGGGGHPYF